MRNRFDRNFKNGIAGWYFEEEEINRTCKNSGILMLDMEYGISCTLDCSYCFRTNDDRDRLRIPSLTPEEAIDIVNQAKEMGAMSIHFVGKGESLEEPEFLDIIDHIAKLGMIPLVFTAGHVLGDDELAASIYGRSGEDIVTQLYESNASIILKLNSLNHEIQNDVVRRPTIGYKNGTVRDFNYTKVRDIALDRLMKAGFNSWEHNPTRLGIATVMLKSNYYELPYIYKYFRFENVYPIINTVVPCGRTKNMREVEAISPTREEKFKLWKKIYSFNIENGIKYEGISSYVGGHICSQLGYAMYINVFGDVFDCPSSTRLPIGNVRLNGNNSKKLRDLWKGSPFRKKYQYCKDHGCPWRFSHPAMIPKDLFRTIDEYLRQKYPNNPDIQNFVPSNAMARYYGNRCTVRT
jgi:MoaA/NifB/PqqE/SkfB family radical SAM enzyme